MPSPRQRGAIQGMKAGYANITVHGDGSVSCIMEMDLH